MLPQEIHESLEKFWKDVLTPRYQIKFYELDGNSYHQKMNDLFVTSSNFTKVLENTYIDTPNGKRQISMNEAGDIVKFVNTASIKVIEQANTLETMK